MLVTLAWGAGVGVVIALVDVLASQLSLRITDTDLSAAIELLDLLINLGLCGMAGYRVAAARGELRSGLEAAVLAGLIAGLSGVGYNLARGPEQFAAADAVYLVAMNVVLAAGAGALGAWGGSAAGLRQPPGNDRGSRRQ
jgi:hypothetical protein